MHCIKYIVVTENCFLKIAIKNIIREAFEKKAAYIIIDGLFALRAADAASRHLANNTFIIYDEAHYPHFSSWHTDQILPLPHTISDFQQQIVGMVNGVHDINSFYNDPLTSLTLREFNILRQIMGGDSQNKISRIENISIKTVSACKRRAMHKLQVNTLQELYYRIITH